MCVLVWGGLVPVILYVIPLHIIHVQMFVSGNNELHVYNIWTLRIPPPHIHTKEKKKKKKKKVMSHTLSMFVT